MLAAGIEPTRTTASQKGRNLYALKIKYNKNRLAFLHL